VSKIRIRRMTEKDCIVISEAFQAQGWNKPYSLYEKYFSEQQAKKRIVFTYLVKAFWRLSSFLKPL